MIKLKSLKQVYNDENSIIDIIVFINKMFHEAYNPSGTKEYHCAENEANGYGKMQIGNAKF